MLACSGRGPCAGARLRLRHDKHRRKVRTGRFGFDQRDPRDGFCLQSVSACASAAGTSGPELLSRRSDTTRSQLFRLDPEHEHRFAEHDRETFTLTQNSEARPTLQ